MQAGENLEYFIKNAIKNNLQLNAKEKILNHLNNLKIFQKVNFLPNITITGDQTSSTSTNRSDQSGSNLPDSNLDTESKSISLEQKIFLDLKE